MTREMNKPDWLMAKHYCLICRQNIRPECANCLFNKSIPKNRKLDDWIKPFMDSINERFKQCGKQ